MRGPAMSSSCEPIGFVTWADRSPTGGNVYNTELIAALRSRGIPVRLHRLPGRWPAGSPADRARLLRALRQGRKVIVDGIVAGVSPEEVGEAVDSGTFLAVLVHLPVGEEVGLPQSTREAYRLAERRVIGTASAVLCPSRHAAARIQELYGRSRLTIAVPGVRPAAPAAGSSPPRLLCVGALTPTKNQLGLLAALGELADLPWTAALVGSTESSVGYAASVAGAAARLGGRVRLTGVLYGADLEREWGAADLLVLPSRVETYGMVVAEALAHGIPAVVTAGTGAEEALGSATEDGLPGCAVPAAELAPHLRPWLTDPKLRARWRRAAGRRRQCQPSWEQTAAAVLAALPGGGEPGGREVEVQANVLAEDVPADGNA